MPILTTAAAANPAATPPIKPYPISSSKSFTASPFPIAPLWVSAIVIAISSNGTQIPSLSPLSTLSPWRTRTGTRGSVTTASPSAASVGARTMASRIASISVTSPNIATPASVPATIVRGNPIASKRRGTTYSRRKVARLTRDASEKSTTVKVASATRRTDSLSIAGLSQLRAASLNRIPPATNTIAAVITEVESRRETLAYARSRSAIPTSGEPDNSHAPPPEARQGAALEDRYSDSRTRR